MTFIHQKQKKSALLGNGINIQFGGKAYSNRFIISRIVFNARCDKYDSLFEGTLTGEEIEKLFRRLPLEDWFLLLRLFFLDNQNLTNMWKASKAGLEWIILDAIYYFDQALCMGLSITDEDIDALCKAMKEQAIKNAHNEEQKAAVKDVGRQQLRSWGVLIEREGKDYPSNAYAILTGCGLLHTVTQCGVFKGTTKEVFVDRREYTGPVWEQIDEAFQFVLRNIHLGATIVGIYRQDVYEIPPDAIRELIINAAVHRSYLDHGNIQIAVYDNRLEITSPGKLPMGQNLERMKEGYSQIRNEALAYAFSYMNLIEHWGSGIPRIIGKVKAAGLREPEFIGGEVDLRINIYRGQVDTNNAMINANGIKNGVGDIEKGTNGVKIPQTKEQIQVEKLLQVIEKNPSATQAYYAEQIGLSKRTVSRMFVALQEKGVLVQNGTKRKSNWTIIK